MFWKKKQRLRHVYGRDIPDIDFPFGTCDDGCEKYKCGFYTTKEVALRGGTERRFYIGRGIDLMFAYISFADLRGANLRGAMLYEAHLIHTDFEGATFRNAILRDADLRGANLKHVDLRGADLIGAQLDNANLAGVIVDSNTACPQWETYGLPRCTKLPKWETREGSFGLTYTHFDLPEFEVWNKK
jgi:hypothetical protein